MGKVMVFKTDRWGDNKAQIRNYISAVHTEDVYGNDSLRIRCFEDLIKGDELSWTDPDNGVEHHQTVVSSVRTHDRAGRPTTEARCMNRVCELFLDDLTARSFQSKTLAYMLTNQSSYGILYGTRWTYVEQSGSPFAGKAYSIDFEDMSVREAIGKIREMLGAEMHADHPQRTIQFYDEYSRSGSTDNTGYYSYERDMSSASREYQPDEVYTALRATGADDITTTVYNVNALNQWGRPGGNGSKVHAVGRYVNNDCTTLQQLRTAATAELAKVSTPRISYTFQLEDVGGAYPGDYVRISDKTFEPAIAMNGRVTEVSKDLASSDKRSGKVVVGSRVPRRLLVAFDSLINTHVRDITQGA